MTFAGGELHFFEEVGGKFVEDCLGSVAFDVVGLSVFYCVLDLILATLENHEGRFGALRGVILDIMKGTVVTY